MLTTTSAGQPEMTVLQVLLVGLGGFAVGVLFALSCAASSWHDQRRIINTQQQAIDGLLAQLDGDRSHVRVVRQPRRERGA
jgi:hypothetical protein